MKNLHRFILVSALPFAGAIGLNAANFTGPDGGLWSNSENWSTSSVPAASEEMLFALAENRSVVVDGDYTIQSVTDGFAPGLVTLGGTGTLTIDIAQSGTGPGLTNATGDPGGVVLITGNLAINNSGEARTLVRTSNSSSNVVRFSPESHLILTTGLQTRGTGAGIEFNGKVSGSAIFVGSQNAIIGEGHDSTELSEIVFFNDGLLTINGGTVLNAGQKFQVNGSNTMLVLNGENAVNGANIRVGGTNDLLVDVNTNQENMGFISLANGSLTIDVDPAVTNVSFASAYFQEWGSATITINGFEEETIRFGTDGSGLTREQLAVINGGIYSLTSDGYLTEASVSHWARFEIGAEDYVSMSPWIERFAYVGSAPYIWIVDAGWVYMEETVGVNGNGWIYAYTLAGLDIYRVDETGFGYSFGLNRWVYSPDEVSGNAAGWAYVL